MKIAILGTGWLGTALYRKLLQQNKHIVYGSSRKAEVRNRLSNLAVARDYQSSELDIISQVQADPPPHRMFAISAPHFRKADEAFFKVNTLIVTLPPGRKRKDVGEVYSAEIKSVLEQAEQAGINHLIYTSSTGVYGNPTGKVVESTPVNATTESAKAVAAAETIITSGKIPATILRLAGLYGPSRHPGRWFAGKEDIANGDAPVNLVHQSDVVQAIMQSIRSGPPASGLDVFNICAATHPTRKAYYSKAATDYGEEAGNWLAGGEQDKWIDATKAREQLDWHPVFDDLTGY